MPQALLPILLLAHVVLALALFLPSFLLPFAFRAKRGPLSGERPGGGSGSGASGGPGAFVRFLLWLQARGTLWIGIGLAITGVGLLATIGFETLQQPWLLAALAIYAANLGLVLRAGAPSPPADRPSRRQRPAVGRARATAAVHLVCHGRARGYHRVPHEHEAGAVVRSRR